MSAANRPTNPELTMTDVPAQRRYEARVGDELAGWVDYRRVHGRLIAVHTEVEPAFGGRGIATALVSFVLAEARASGIKVTPLCPYFRAYFERHPEDADLRADPGGRESAGRDASAEG